MVPQHLQYTAVCGSAPAALAHHALQLRAKRLEPGKHLLHLSQLSPRDLVGLGTWPARVIGQIKQLEDCVERKAQLARMPDEGQQDELRTANHGRPSGKERQCQSV